MEATHRPGPIVMWKQPSTAEHVKTSPWRRAWKELRLFYVESSVCCPFLHATSSYPWGHQPQHRGSFSNPCLSPSSARERRDVPPWPGAEPDQRAVHGPPTQGTTPSLPRCTLMSPQAPPMALPGRSRTALTVPSVPVHRDHQRKGQLCRRNRLRVLICVPASTTATAGHSQDGIETGVQYPRGERGTCSPQHHPLSSAAVSRLRTS